MTQPVSMDDIHAYHVELYNEQHASEISKAIDLGAGPRIIKTRMSNWRAGSMSSYIEWILRTYAVRGVEIPEADQYWKVRGIRH